jgi:hypothetical protein
LLHVERARQYRTRLLALFPDTNYGDVNKDANTAHVREWRKDGLDTDIIKKRLHPYWISIYEFVRYLGFALIVIPIAFAIVLTIIVVKYPGLLSPK